MSSHKMGQSVRAWEVQPGHVLMLEPPTSTFGTGWRPGRTLRDSIACRVVSVEIVQRGRQRAYVFECAPLTEREGIVNKITTDALFGQNTIKTAVAR